MDPLLKADEVDLIWVLYALLDWGWGTLILEVGRIALAIQLVLFLPRM